MKTMDDHHSSKMASPLDAVKHSITPAHKKDTFLCGDCGFTSKHLWSFFQHKMSHKDWSGMFHCCLCQSWLATEQTIHQHYLHFHNIKPLTQELIHQLDYSSIQDAINTSEKHLQRGIGNQLETCEIKVTSEGTLSTGCIDQEPVICTVDVARFVEKFCPPAHSNDDSKFHIGENVSCLGSKLQDPHQIESGDESDRNESVPFSRQQLDQTVADGQNVSFETLTECTCRPDRTELLKGASVISSAALSQFKQFAATALTRKTVRESQQKTIIIHSSRSIKIKGREIIQKQIPDANIEQNNIILHDRGPRADLWTESHVDIMKYEKDFLFQTGMKESMGKKIRYMREVYICLYCEALENFCLDRLIIHMSKFHEYEIMDRCHPAKMRNIKARDVIGITEANVTSFQEFRTKLLNQRSLVEERKAQIQKEKSLSKQLVGMPCLYCSKRFITPNKLQAHTDRHLSMKQFLCEECGKSFRTWHLLQCHKKGHMNASYGKIKCSRCSFQSGDTQALNKHYRIHPKQSHLCHICGNMYSSLRKHVKVHSLDRPYPCPYLGCTFRFTSEVPRKIHYQAHTAQGQRFSCSKCNCRFSRKHHLIRHQVKVHGESIDTD